MQRSKQYFNKMLCDVFVIIVRYSFIVYLIMLEMILISFKVTITSESKDLLHNEKLLYCPLQIPTVIDITYKISFFIHNTMNNSIIFSIANCLLNISKTLKSCCFIVFRQSLQEKLTMELTLLQFVIRISVQIERIPFRSGFNFAYVCAAFFFIFIPVHMQMI